MLGPQTNPGLARVYLFVLQRYWWVLAGCAVCAWLLGFLYLSQAEPIYEAQVRVLIQDRGLSLDGRPSHSKDKDFLSTQAELIRSPLTISRALGDVKMTVPGSSNQDAVNDAMESLQVSPMARTDIVKVSYRCADPQLAVGRLRAIVQSYREDVRHAERNVATKTLQLLERREESLREQLQMLQREDADLRSASPLIGEPRDGVSVEATSLKELSDRLNEARSQRVRIENCLNALREHADTELPFGESTLADVLDEQVARTIGELERELALAQTHLQQTALVYGPRHPERQAAEARLSSLQAVGNERKAEIVERLRQRLDVARAVEQGMESLYEKEHARLKSLDKHLLKKQQLHANRQLVEQLHESALATLQDFELTDQALADGRASVLVRVLDDFVPPEQPIWPQPVPVLAACALLGLLGGVVGIVAVQRPSLPNDHAMQSNSCPVDAALTRREADADPVAGRALDQTVVPVGIGAIMEGQNPAINTSLASNETTT